MKKQNKGGKPKSELSKVEKARRALISNPANTDRKTLERQKAALEQAKLEVEAQKAYKREYKLRMIAAAKAQARLDAANDAAKKSAKKPRR